MRKTIADRSFFATGILDTQNTESPKESLKKITVN